MSNSFLLAAPDETLCELSKSGNKEAESVLVSRYLGLVRACASEYYIEGGSADDLSQEGLIGLLSAIRRAETERGTFRAFATRCIKNRILDSIRKAGRGKHRPLNRYVELDETHASASLEQQFLDVEEYNERLEQMKALLSAYEDEVLSLYLDGMATADISARLTKPLKSVENALARARRKVSKSL